MKTKLVVGLQRLIQEWYCCPLRSDSGRSERGQFLVVAAAPGTYLDSDLGA